MLVGVGLVSGDGYEEQMAVVRSILEVDRVLSIAFQAAIVGDVGVARERLADAGRLVMGGVEIAGSADIVVGRLRSLQDGLRVLGSEGLGGEASRRVVMWATRDLRSVQGLLMVEATANGRSEEPASFSSSRKPNADQVSVLVSEAISRRENGWSEAGVLAPLVLVEEYLVELASALAGKVV